MRAAIVALLMPLVGCSSSAALELAEAISTDDRAHVQALLAADATFVTPAETIVGKDSVAVSLSALPAGGSASGHHDVAQLVLPDEVLFALGADAVRSLALFEGEGADEVPAAIADYVAAWNEPEAERRGELLAAFAKEGRYVDPTVDAVGRDALVAHLTEFRDAQPGTTLERTSPVRQSGEWYLFDWVLKSGGTSSPGTDVVRLDEDGRVAFVAGFF